jgi:putative hydrolase
VKLRGLARDRGLSISEYGLAPIDPASGPGPEVREEADLYRALGLAPVPPELREDHGEIELARDNALPDLISREDIQGFVHCHSTWSDGKASIEDMVRGAKALGAKFITMTDHSQAAHYAGGLGPDQIRRQWDEIAEVEARVGGIRVLRGSEVDILEDGSLDQADDILERLDVVVASVHSKLRMEKQAMTRRMITAIANPHTDVLGHCTGRYVTGRGRPQSEFDAEIVFHACERFDTAVEINSRPERLDPPNDLLALAVEMGCRFAINTDAHAPGQLEWQAYGADKAVETGVTIDRVVNSWSADELVEWTRR